MKIIFRLVFFIALLSLYNTNLFANDLISKVHAYTISLPNGRGSLINKINNRSAPYSITFYWVDSRAKKTPLAVKTFSNFYHTKNIFSFVIPAPTNESFDQLLIVDSDGYSCGYTIQNNLSLSSGTCNGTYVSPYIAEDTVRGENPTKVGTQQSAVFLNSEITNVQQISIGDLSREDFFGNHHNTTGLKSVLTKPQRKPRTLTIKNFDTPDSKYVYIFGADFGPEAIDANNRHRFDNQELITTINKVVDNPKWLQSYGTITLSQILKHLPEYNKQVGYIWIKDPFNGKSYQAAYLSSQNALSLNVDDPLFKNLYYQHSEQANAALPFRLFAMYRIEKSRLNESCGMSATTACNATNGLTNIYTNKTGTDIFGTQFEITYHPNEVTEDGKVQNKAGELDNGTTYDASYVDGVNVLISYMTPFADAQDKTLALGKTGGVIFGNSTNITSKNYRSTLYLRGNEVDISNLDKQLRILHAPDNNTNGFNVIVNDKDEPIAVASACTAANMDPESTVLERNRACCKGIMMGIGDSGLDFTDPTVCTQSNWEIASDIKTRYNVFRSLLYTSASNLTYDPIPALPKSEITSGYTFAYADSTSTYVVPNQTQNITFGFVTPVVSNYGKKIIS